MCAVFFSQFNLKLKYINYNFLMMLAMYSKLEILDLFDQVKSHHKVNLMSVLMCNIKNSNGLLSTTVDIDWLEQHKWKAFGKKAFIVIENIEGIDDIDKPMSFYHASKSLLAGVDVKFPPDRRERFNGLALAHDSGGLTRFNKDQQDINLVRKIEYDGSEGALNLVIKFWNNIDGNPAKEEIDAENIKKFLESVVEYKSLPFTVDIYSKDVSEEIMYYFPSKMVKEGDITIDDPNNELNLKIGTVVNKDGIRIPMLKHFGAELDIAVPNFTRLNMRQYKKV
jgi:hypothetical protein